MFRVKEFVGMINAFTYKPALSTTSETNIKIEILEDAGLNAAMLGLGLSFGLTSDKSLKDLESKEIPSGQVLPLYERLFRRAKKLSGLDMGHNKFLESIVVWIDITAPRYFWSQFDTYRVGTTKQSESTMHTVMNRHLTSAYFSSKVRKEIIDILNKMIDEGDFEGVKENLPEGFLQRRIVCTNYKVLRNMCKQRKSHKLKEWRIFCDYISEHIKAIDICGDEHVKTCKN